jgi:hypothetical protein
MDIPKNQEQVIEFVQQGKINNVLTMPTLYSINKNGKYLLWTIYIGLTVPSDDEEEEESTKIIPITDEYINRGKLPKHSAGTYWTISGIEGMKMTRSENTYVFAGKNIGKKNFTTPLTQAILNARTIFNNKIRKGHVLSKKFLKKLGEVYTFEDLLSDKTRGEHPWRVFAMAVHEYKKNKDKISYPATIQYKLDGTLFIVVHHPLLPEISVLVEENEENGENEENEKERTMRLDGYSRGKETIEGQEHIYNSIYNIALKYPGLHFVGELWKEGYGLQEVSGISRRKLDSKKKEDKILLDFNIFDCFYIDRPELGFMDRQQILLEISSQLGEQKYVKFITTHMVDDEEEMLKLYHSFIEKGLEGAIVRNADSPYEFGINKEVRSYQSLKLKPRPDAEWPVVGFTCGKGKETNAVIWVCAENDEGVVLRAGKILPLEERKIFNVTPNQPTDLRKQIYEKLSKNQEFFQKEIYGKLLVISYSVLSNDKLPQQPKALRFREPEISEKILE